jgi:hypothetical protein
LSDEGIGGAALENIIGDISTRFEVQAQALDLGNRFEADALISTTRARGVLDRIAGRVGDRTRIAELFQGRGSVAGFRNLVNLFNEGDELTIGGVVGLLRGDVDLNDQDALAALGGSSRIRQLAGQLQNAKGDAASRAQLGLGALIQGRITGRIEGELLSAEQREEVQELLQDENLSQEQLRGFFDRTFRGSVKRRELLVEGEAARLGSSLSADRRGKASVRSNLTRSARTLLENKDLEGLGELETIEDRDKFVRSLQLESKIAEEMAGSDLDAQRKEFEARLGERTDLFSFRELQELKEQEDIANQDISLSGTRAGAEGILAQILKVVQDLAGGAIPVSVSKENGTAPTLTKP